MENSFTVKTAFKMGEYDEKYGQTWYCTVEEIGQPVMFNLMDKEQTVQEVDKITFEEQLVQTFKSGKNQGKEYRRLKKVKVLEGAPRLIDNSPPKTSLEERVAKLEAAVFGEGDEDTSEQDEFAEPTDDDYDRMEV